MHVYVYLPIVTILNFYRAYIYIYIYVAINIYVARSCHKAIMVITGRAHCYTFCIFRSLLMQFEHSFGLGGESILDVHYLQYA